MQSTVVISVFFGLNCTNLISLRTRSQQGQKKITRAKRAKSVEVKNSESKVIGGGIRDPVDFVFGVPIHPW